MILKPLPLKGYKKFKELFFKGIRLDLKGFSIYYIPAYDFPLRYSVVVSSRYGKAVKRNKLKRQVRAILDREGFNFLPFFGNLLIYFKEGLPWDWKGLNNALKDSFKELQRCLKNLH